MEGDSFFGFVARGAITPWLRESNEQNVVVTEAAVLLLAASLPGAS